MRNLIDGLRAAWRNLRCRPGDVCWVTRDVWVYSADSAPVVGVKGGTIVCVVRLRQGSADMWCLESRIPLPQFGIDVVALRDCVLQPLRDRPGRDEIFRYAVPPEFMETATAPKPERVEC